MPRRRPAGINSALCSHHPPLAGQAASKVFGLPSYSLLLNRGLSKAAIVPVYALMDPGHLLLHLFQFTFVTVSDESPVGRSKFKEFTDQSILSATKVYIWSLPRFPVRPEHLAFDA